jgi:hypothetical protein
MKKTYSSPNFHDSFLGLLAVLIYLSLTALVFAAWNVGASLTAGAHGEWLSTLWSGHLNDRRDQLTEHLPLSFLAHP